MEDSARHSPFPTPLTMSFTSNRFNRQSPVHHKGKDPPQGREEHRTCHLSYSFVRYCLTFADIQVF